MGLDERFELFGDPTETLAAESVWLFKQENGDWPLWQEAIEFLAESEEVGGDLVEAERRLSKAIVDGELLPITRCGRYLEMGVTLSDEMADHITRRYMDASMPRDRE